VTAVLGASADRVSPIWIRNAGADAAAAWAWVPVYVFATLLSGDALRTLAGAVFLFSLMHQALTPFLLATDAPTRQRHRVVYVLGAPLVLVGSVCLVRLGMTWVAVIAAAWNLVHTLRQRYGVVRLYGRAAGQSRARAEQVLLFGPFVMTAALIVSLPDQLDSVNKLGFGGVNRSILDGLQRIAPFAPIVCVLAGIATALTVVRLWRSRSTRPVSEAKQLYLLAYFVSLAAAIVDPVAGLLGLVAAHSFEYCFVLEATIGKRFGQPGTALHRWISVLRNQRWVLAVWAAIALTVIVGLRSTLSPNAYLLAYMTIGGSHFLFDGFMWGSGRGLRSA
jgi:hypothetical protein